MQINLPACAHLKEQCAENYFNIKACSGVTQVQQKNHPRNFREAFNAYLLSLSWKIWQNAPSLGQDILLVSIHTGCYLEILECW